MDYKVKVNEWKNSNNLSQELKDELNAMSEKELQDAQPDIEEEEDYFSEKIPSPTPLFQEKENIEEMVEDTPSSPDSKNQTESEEEISSDLWKNEKSLFNNLEEIDETEESEDDEDLFNPSSNILPSQIKDKRLKDIQNEILSLTESKNQDKLDLDEE